MPKALRKRRWAGMGKRIGHTRILLLLMLGIPGVVASTGLAISGITRTRNPDLALQFLPTESAALAAKADRLFFANPQKPSPLVRSLSLSALRNQALNAKALRLLGYYADTEGNNATAWRYIRMAETISRRETGAQLWLIEASARQGTEKQTLVHYDIALRTKPETQVILFPRLLSAIESEEIRTSLTRYMNAKDGWADDFVEYSNINGKNLPPLVDLIVESGGLRNVKNGPAIELALLNRLVGEKLFTDARRLYLQMPGATAKRLTSADLDSSDLNARFGAVGWQIVEDADAGGSFIERKRERDTSLSVFANPSTTRTVARKLLYLTPGRNYVFVAKLASIDRSGGGFLSWQLTCPLNNSSQPIWTYDSFETDVAATFAVPSDCPVQFLNLVVSGGTGQTGIDATIRAVSVVVAKNELGQRTR
jgi:hypothetical protein